jgi:hypothetical protein
MLDTFFIAAPQGSTWPLDIDTVDQRLQERFPGMRGEIVYSNSRRQHYLSFDIDVDGTTRTGAYYVGNLILNDGDEADWAPTIAWFLSLLPPGTAAVTMRETNPDQIPLLPTDPSPAQIQQILEDLAIE